MKTYIDGLKKALEILEANECEADGYHYCSQQDTYKNLIKAEIESLPFEAEVIKKIADTKKEFDEKFVPYKPYYQTQRGIIYWTDLWKWFEEKLSNFSL